MTWTTNDAIFIGKRSKSNVKFLARLLRCFQLTSGLRINFGKSKMYNVGPDENDIAVPQSILNCKLEKLPFIYLGIQVGANMSRIKYWDGVINKVQARLNSWKARQLSQGGREVLIKSVLGSIPQYYLSIFRAPAAVIKKLEAIRRNFFWGGCENKNKIPWVAWDCVTAPKHLGGTGIGKLKDFNLAMLSKWGWRMKSESNTLWAKIIAAIHHSSRSHNHLPLKKSIPGCWKAICHTIDELPNLQVSFWAEIKPLVGLGDTVSFWSDSWLLTRPLREEFPDLYALEKFKSCRVSSRITTSLNSRSLRWDWKHPPSHADHSRILQITSLIDNYSFRNGADRWSWLGSNDLTFHSNNIRKQIEGSRDAFPYIHLWSHWIPKKVELFSWKAALERIPVKQELIKKGVNVLVPACQSCFKEDESVTHLLLKCEKAQTIWNNMREWCRFTFFTSGSTAQVFTHLRAQRLSPNKLKLLITIAAATFWQIWKARNIKEFEDRFITPARVADEIKSETYQWLGNRSKLDKLDWSEFKMYALYKV